MNCQRVAIIFSVLNLLLIIFLQAQIPSDAQQSITQVIRTRAFELVDENGKIRAQINVEKTGEVVFRLRDEKGIIRSKYSANEKGSGLSLMNDRTEATVQIRANQSGSGITFFDRGGNKKEIK